MNATKVFLVVLTGDGGKFVVQKIKNCHSPSYALTRTLDDIPNHLHRYVENAYVTLIATTESKPINFIEESADAARRNREGTNQ